MNNWHRISGRDETARTGVCSICGPVALRRRERRGSVEWICSRRNKELARPRHRLHLGTECVACGFKAIHAAQLDAHHINENHDDNRPQNIVTLCANCHRLLHAVGPGAVFTAEQWGQVWIGSNDHNGGHGR